MTSGKKYLCCMPSTTVAPTGVYCSHNATYVSNIIPVETATAHHKNTSKRTGMARATLAASNTTATTIHNAQNIIMARPSVCRPRLALPWIIAENTARNTSIMPSGPESIAVFLSII